MQGRAQAPRAMTPPAADVSRRITYSGLMFHEEDNWQLPPFDVSTGVLHADEISCELICRTDGLVEEVMAKYVCREDVDMVDQHVIVYDLAWSTVKYHANFCGSFSSRQIFQGSMELIWDTDTIPGYDQGMVIADIFSDKPDLCMEFCFLFPFLPASGARVVW